MSSEAETNLRQSIVRHESLCEQGRAGCNDAIALNVKIQNSLRYLGLDYNTVNLARYGSKRALLYIARGLIDGYTVVKGEVVRLPDAYFEMKKLDTQDEVRIRRVADAGGESWTFLFWEKSGKGAYTLLEKSTHSNPELAVMEAYSFVKKVRSS